ncbi:MAG: tRNA pseudouridine(38-40) synthase TruA [Deltaproteobacteria bacterium HGW-Deltaproteobacteria-12]|jgi:tRNA pseudouridine38-40 synthase|nr:MAG: tRNA pseudouridine(38-40) synthase TruA [Deltaproteobacteria bacterium HGW-Deltaproteobacteria-12]
MRNFKMIVEYDGTGYCGWQRQENGLSIQQVLEEIIQLITQEKVTVIGSGRTDAGVHALNQVASFRCNTRLPAETLFRGLNGLLPHDIVLKALEEVAGEFHAQHDVRGKIYVYRICNKSLRPALGRNYFWFIRHPLDLILMEKAAQYLIGTHDFSSFCATGTQVKDRTRTVTSISINSGEDGLLEISIEAQGFLKYMVRNIVGTLVEIGRGQRPPAAMKEIIDSCDRNIAGPTAPARGLYLKEVKY